MVWTDAAGARQELRRVAVARVLDGYDPREVAEFLEVGTSSVYRWVARYAADGEAGLATAARPGRPPRLTAAQRAEVLSWAGRDAREFGFDVPCWTAPRLAAAVE